MRRTGDVATPTALLLGVLLGPALLASCWISQPGRPGARSIALCGLAAALIRCGACGQPAYHGRRHGLLSEPRVLAMAWVLPRPGWLLAELVPLAVRAALEARSSHALPG